MAPSETDPSHSAPPTDQKGYGEDGRRKSENPLPSIDAAVEILTEYPKGFRLASIVIALNLCVFLMSLDNTIIATAIPKITDEFQSLEDVLWYGSAYFLVIGGFQTVWGKVYRYFPLKTSFALAIFIFEIGSLICGAAPTSVALIIGRAIGGLGAAGLGTGAYLMIALAAEPKKQPLFIGLVGMSYGIASVLGPVLGGVFTDSRLTWRWCFYINLPIGGVACLIVLLFFQAPPSAKPTQAPLSEKILQMDPVGAMLIIGGATCYILALHLWTILSGAFISKTGMATHVSVVGTAVLTVSAGLLYTLDIGSNPGKWIGYQLLCGFGAGIAFQVPVIVGQGHSDAKDVSSVTAIILFLQTIGGAFFVSAAQAAFVNRLISTLRMTVPDLDPLLVVGTGATDIRRVFPARQIPGILVAYVNGTKAAFAIAVGAAALAFIVTLFSSWERLNGKVTEVTEKADNITEPSLTSSS
ncbi:hypothetical protein DL765_000338 [Monosporascus sp. GIB2]|nr:hypothetical protein DL765_000338 [Monosporascus sp. GIB2]